MIGRLQTASGSFLVSDLMTANMTISTHNAFAVLKPSPVTGNPCTVGHQSRRCFNTVLVNNQNMREVLFQRNSDKCWYGWLNQNKVFKNLVLT